MSRADRGQDKPRAIIHRRILDVAASDPEAPMAAIADEVSGASTTLVERVLDEYGDPGRETEFDDQDDQSMDATNADDTQSVNGADDGETELPLSEKQRRTLRALYERPDASQGDLAEELDVTRATISRRLNAIPGFEWTDRHAFAESVFGEDDSSGADSEDGTVAGTDSTATESDGGSEMTEDAVESDETGQPDVESDATDSDDVESDTVEPGEIESGEGGGAEVDADTDAGAERVESRADSERRFAALEDRLAAIESRLDGIESDADPSIPPELAHKVVHACVESDRLTEDEELAVLRSLME